MTKHKGKIKNIVGYNTQTNDIFNPFPLKVGENKTLCVCKELLYVKNETVKGDGPYKWI